MAVELPLELVEQILSRLPSKSLLRCRSVCKSWLALISSAQFRLMHLHSFNQLNSRYLVRRLIRNEEEYALHFDDQHFTLDTSSSIQALSIFDIGEKVYYIEIIGSCNGVICLWPESLERDEIILWNPSIRRKVTLIPPVYRESDVDIRYGFGYHKTSDDYKVVRLAYDPRLDPNPAPQVQIYSTKAGNWRAVVFPNDLPPIIEYDCSQVLNGSVHWISFDQLVIRYTILTFDMSTELFGQIQIPKSAIHKGARGMKLAVIGDSLAMVYSSRRRKPWLNSSTYKIWAMKDYNDPMSWRMIYKVRYPDNYMGRALGLTKNGGLITVGSTIGDVMICNQAGRYSLYGSCSKDIDLDYTFVERYQESLVLLDHVVNHIQDTEDLNDDDVV